MEESSRLKDIGTEIISTYDAVLEGCSARDKRKAVDALAKLMEGLNFENEQIAGGLLRLYDYCAGRIQSGHFDEAERIVRQLRDTWIEGMENLEAGSELDGGVAEK